MSLKLRIPLTLKNLLLILTLILISTTEEDLKTKLYYKHNDFTFPIVNLPFIRSNIPAAPAYGLYISQLACCSRACAQYCGLLDSSAANTKATQTRLCCY